MNAGYDPYAGSVDDSNHLKIGISNNDHWDFAQMEGDWPLVWMYNQSLP